MTPGITLQAQAPAAGGADLGFRLATLINGQPMAMREQELSLLVEAIAANRFTLPRNRKTGARITEKGTAIVEVHGLLIDRFPILSSIGWLTAYEGLAEQFRRIATNTDIKRVVLDFDTPGGLVAGIRGCGDELARLAEKKPVHAIAHNMACSAGYWLACIAEELSVTPDGEVGSIGVRAGHISYAEALDRDGIGVTVFTAGATKADRSPFRLLDAGAAAEEQYGIERAYDRFCEHVAAHRPLSVKEVRGTDARCFAGERAVEAKLADRVETLDELVTRIEASASKVKRRKKSPIESGSKAGLGSPERYPARPDEDEPTARRTAKTGAKLMSNRDESAEVADFAEMMTATFEKIAREAVEPKPAAEANKPATATTEAAKPAAEVVQSAVDAALGRVFAVLDCDEAVKRPKLARALAKSGLPLEAAKAILAASAEEKAIAEKPAEGAPNALGNALEKQMQKPGNAAGVKPEASDKKRPSFVEVAEASAKKK